MVAESKNRMSPRRLEAYTDGVFAIAATLLVLDVSVDALGSGIRTNRQLWAAFDKLVPQLISFGISFLILGALWAAHTGQFEKVRFVDPFVLTLNTVRLLGVVLVPFSTSLNGSYGGFIIGRLILPANFLFILAVAAVQWFYLTVPARGLIGDLSAEELRRTRLGAIGGLVAAALATAVAPWVGSWAFLAFTLNRLFTRLLDPISRRGRAARVPPRVGRG